MTAERICVIGAGPSGLAACRHLRAAGFDFDCLERELEVGGNWHASGRSSSVCHSTHLISSVKFTQFPDFPMPSSYPHYPHARQVGAYLRDYADHFGLREHIELDREVLRVERPHGGSAGDWQGAPAESGERFGGREVDRSTAEGWWVWVAGEERPREYGRLVIANGHHWDPLIPSWAHDFTGEVWAARDYKEPEQLRGRRILVVGGGNSGCDLAVEGAAYADSCDLSLRRGYYFLPKFVAGLPTDVAGELLVRCHLPLWLRRVITRVVLRLLVGPLGRYGLPQPDHRLFETHPIVNSQLLYALGHGRVRVRPGIARCVGTEVVFQDGSTASYDTLVLATGYRLSFPFIDSQFLNAVEGVPQLFLHAFHPERDDLFVMGMIQPNGGQWPLTDMQARLMVRYLKAAEQRLPVAERFRAVRRAVKLRGQEGLAKDSSVLGGIEFDASDRHRLEVDYFAYLEQARRWERAFDTALSSAGSRLRR